MTKLNKTKLALLGATALFASTSAHAQVADTWTITGDMAITSSNTGAAVTLTGSPDGADAAQTQSPTITDGTRNSISASAVGSSGSASFNSTSNTDGSFSAAIVGATSVTTDNAAAVTNAGSVTNANIVDGSQNSISRAAVGTSASVSANVVVDNGATHDSTYAITGDTTLAATNTGAVTTLVDLGTAGDATQAPVIAAGNNNGISASGVGSSASISLSTNLLNGATEATSFAISTDLTNQGAGAISVTSQNDGDVTVASTADATAQGGIYGAQVQSGNANNISVNAVGSSASVSYTSNVFDGTLTGNVNIASTGSDAAATQGTIAITSTNNGGITNLTNIGADASTDDAPTIGADATNSSIGVAGIGSSASFSLATNDLTGGAGSITNVISAGAPTIGAVNTGDVLVASSIFNPTIAGGLGNSISTSAVGASASQSFSNFTK